MQPSTVMSLLSLFSGLLDQHGDTAQQAALLAYLKQGEEAQPYLEAVLAARLAGTVYRTLSKEDQYEAARNETVLSIAKWVKEHPRATQVSLRESPCNQYYNLVFQSQTQEEVNRQILLFKHKIEQI